MYVSLYTFNRWFIRTALALWCLMWACGAAATPLPAGERENSSFFLNNEEDTTRRFRPLHIISLTDSSRRAQQEVQTKKFYRNLKSLFYRSRVTKELFDLLFVKPADLEPVPDKEVETIERYEPFEEKVIGNINIRKLELFGPKVTDTTRTPGSWIQKALNNIHTPTLDQVIRKSLLIKTGEQVEPQLIADNERLLRELSFIRDARIHLLPRSEDSDTVDVLVLTQDVLPYSAGGNYRSLNSLSLILRNNNIGGTGHELRNEVLYDQIQVPSFGYRGVYSIPNIGGRFLNSRIEYSHSEYEKNLGGNLQRTFYTPEVRWAGGIQLNRTTLKRGILFRDQAFDSLFHYQYDYVNAWGAHAFRLWKEGDNRHEGGDERSRIVVAARFSRTDFGMRPGLSPSELQFFHDNKLYLASIGWSRRQYFRDYYLFGFGRTEDIPYGGLVNFTFGKEEREFSDYTYAGLNMARGSYIWRFGYLYNQINIGSYFHRNWEMERRQLHLLTNYYSPLWQAGNYSFRQIISIDYLYGDRRYDHEFLHIRYENIRGLSTLERRGTQRFSFRFETVSFTPLYILGFQFAGYAFADLSLLNTEPRISLRGEDFHGYGLGLRIRNENLTFNTFQIRFSLYPNSEGKGFGISISTIPGQIFNDFLIGEPRPLEFR